MKSKDNKVGNRIIISCTTMMMILILFIQFAEAKDWTLIWSDEFNVDGSPDNTKWSFDVDGNSWDWGNNELQNYTPAEKENAWVENGELIIEARKEKYTAPEDNQERDYTSARLRTLNKGDWLYGKFEIRAKLPRGKGTWPAIWMLNSEENNWPHSGELDIMESIGKEPGKIYSTVWCTETESSFGYGNTTYLSDPFETFHIYSMEWDKDSIHFYVDGKAITHWSRGSGEKTHWPFTQKFHLLLNVAVGGDWEGSVADSTFNNPVRMHVDYVRVYKESETSLKKRQQKLKGIFKANNKRIEINTSETSFNKGQLDIYTLSGRLVNSSVLTSERKQYIDLSFLSKGTFISTLNLDGIIYKRKITIQ